MLLHLVFDGVWNDTDLFWWPLGGWGFDDAALPEVGPGLVGRGARARSALAVLVWVWRASRLSDPAARRRFLHDGRLFTGTA